MHQGIGHLVLLDVGVLDVADRIRQLGDERRDAFVALAARAGGPVDGGALTDLGLPLGVYLGQVVGEDEGDKIMTKLESIDEKQKQKINEEFGRMKTLMGYTQKTQ